MRLGARTVTLSLGLFFVGGTARPLMDAVLTPGLRLLTLGGAILAAAACSGTAVDKMTGTDQPSRGDGGGIGLEGDAVASDGPGGTPDVLPPLAPAPECRPTGAATTDFDQYLTKLAYCYFSARTTRLAAIKTAAEVLERQTYVRRRLLEEIGGFPARDTPVPPAMKVGEFTADGYRVEKIIYQSQPQFYVTANLWLPANGKGPAGESRLPLIIGPSGHNTVWAKEFFESIWAPLAKLGFAVFAFDPPGQGERRELPFDIPGCCSAEHIITGPALILTGMNLARTEIWDAIRAIDYLESRPDIDPKRIGVAGTSGGGTQSFYLAAFDRRVSAAVPMNSMGSWKYLWPMNGMGDSEQVFTNFIRDGLDESDFPLAMAAGPGEPSRAFKSIQGINDPDFPVLGARAVAKEAAQFFNLLGHTEQYEYMEHSNGHDFEKYDELEATFKWLQRWVVGSVKPTPGVQVFPENLKCTRTGRVVKDFPNAKTVTSLNWETAKQQYAERSASKPMTPEKLRTMVAARIVMTSDRSAAPATKTIGAVAARNGYSMEPLRIETDAGFEVAASLLLPAGASGPSPAVLYVGRAPSSTVGVEPDAEALARAGYAVLLVEPRGSDLVHVDPVVSDLSNKTAYTQSMKGLMLGRPLVGMRVMDILRAFDFLKGRKEVDPKRIALFGKAWAGLAALHAAVLEPDIQKVAAEDMLLSYVAVTAVPQTFETLDLLIPGVLRDYDLPDLAKAMSPRPVWIVSPRTATAHPAPIGEAQTLYGSTGARVLERTRGAAFVETYREWLP